MPHPHHPDISPLDEGEPGYDFLEAVLDAMDVALLVVDGQSRVIVHCNRAAESLFGCPAKSMIGRTTEFLHVNRDHFERFAREGNPVLDRDEPFHTEFVMRRQDGTLFPSEHWVMAIRPRDRGVFRVVSLIRDLTPQKQREADLKNYTKRLQRLSVHLAETEERERHCLAQELHDRVGQNLAALSFHLAAIKERLSGEADDLLLARLDSCFELLSKTGERIRDVMADLRPEILDAHGLPAAIRWYGRRFQDMTGVRVKMPIQEEAVRLPRRLEQLLFRIVQESLINVGKHAQASRVTIRMEHVSDLVTLSVTDNGMGFDPDGVPPLKRHPRWGLMGMQERVRATGGSFTVTSEKGRGTRVAVTLETAGLLNRP